MATFLALYHGDSVSTATLLTLTAEPSLVRDVAMRLLSKPLPDEDTDLVLGEVEQGRRRVLRLVKSEAEQLD